MKKIHIGDDAGANRVDDFDTKPRDIDDLRRRVSTMAVLAEVETWGKKVFVRVQNNAGTMHFMSSGNDDFFWLRKFASKQELKGATTLYYFDL